MRKLPSKKINNVILKFADSKFLEEDLIYLLNSKVIYFRLKMFLT